VIDDDAFSAMGAMAKRNMQLQYTIQDGEVLLSDGVDSANIKPHILTPLLP